MVFDEEQINLIKAFPGPLSRLVGLHLLRQLRREALGFLVLRFWLHFRSVFRFWCSLRFADFPNFSIWFFGFREKYWRVFEYDIRCGFRFFRILAFGFWFSWKILTGFRISFDAVFGFSYLIYLASGSSSIWAAITRLHWSRIADKRKCYREECVTNQLKYRRDP